MTHPAHYHTHKHPHSPPSRGSLIRWLRRLKQHRGVGQLVRIALLLVFGLGTLGGLALLVLFVVAVRDLPDPNSLTNRTIEQSTRIYDKTGTHILYEIFGEENRTLVPLQEGFCKDDPEFPTDPKGVPLFALQATLAAEDRRFCRHFGFDPKGLARAALANLRGSRVGGSTLTQQLVKNAILSNEKTLTRKIKELLLSIELERRYSKDAILQIYFNEIPYGSTYYGIQSASLNLFNKPVSALTLAEAATLAAIPQAPTRYLNNPDRLKVRRDWILDSMATLGYQKQEAVDAAKATDTPITIRVQNIEAPHFVFYVKEQLEEIYGRQLVEEGGLKVITTLDYDKQMIAQKAVSDEVEKNGKSLGFSNAALVALDPKTGHILSMVGSKDFFDKEIGGQVNVTTRLRQPGSSFKPIVYAKAFELGYTPSTILWDVKTVFDTAVGPYIPNNYSGKEYGPISLRNALQGSLNISAVKAMYLVGVESALQFAESLGYSSFKDRSRLGLAVVLGGGEVQLLEHVNAYAAFANGGIHHKTTPILRVEDANGEVLQEWKPEEGQRVMSEQTASWMSQVLSDNNARA